MPNMPDINKTKINIQVSVEDDKRLQNLATQANSSKAKIANQILHEGLKDVVLEAEDYFEIARLIEKRKRSRGL